MILILLILPQCALRDMSKAHYNCMLCNHIPVFVDDEMYAMVKTVLMPEAEKIDPGFKQFDDWWFFKSSDSSKKKHEGGRQRMRNKLNSHAGLNTGVSLCIFYNIIIASFSLNLHGYSLGNS